MLCLCAIGAVVAALLFTCHPVHVEAIASLVGRADCLSGLFYLLAIIAYSSSLRASSVVTASTAFLAAQVSALAAAFSKETGVTAFGVLLVLEAIHYLRLDSECKNASESTSTKSPSSSSAPSFCSSRVASDGQVTVISRVGMGVRVLVTVGSLVGVMGLRLIINGPHRYASYPGYTNIHATYLSYISYAYSGCIPGRYSRTTSTSCPHCRSAL